ncbi:MAG: phage GP46 family protein [Myxococcales bacterium]|jgi:phage gp46-like protein
MGDLKLVWNSNALSADLSVEANDLSTDDGLETAVLLSLFTDRRSEPGDVLPDGDTDRRGWWADAFPVANGDRFGSRLWMLARAKPTQETALRAEEYAREALAWLKDDLVAERIDVSAELSESKMLGIDVIIYRPRNPDPVRYRFSGVWQET